MQPHFSGTETTPARVGLLGGGQLGRMLVEEANRLNVTVNVLDLGHSPAKQVHSPAASAHVDGSFKDADALAKLAAGSDVLTVEIEHVDTEALEAVAAKHAVPVHPSWTTLRTIQDKYAQKEFLLARDIPMAQAAPVDSPADLLAAAERFGYPVMLKARKQAYDGRGNYPVRAPEDVEPALRALGSAAAGGLYAEQWSHFDSELAVMVVKTKDGVLAYPTVELVSQDSVCKLVYAPARGLAREVALKAQQVAREVVSHLDGKGVYGVELFLVGDDILVNEVAPRPHNSGHYTIEACHASQFAAHLRAILDLPLAEKAVSLSRPAVMLNILSGATATSHHELVRTALAIPSATVHLYGKDASRPGRKIGHITVTGVTPEEAEDEIQPLIQIVNSMRAERLGLSSSDPDCSSASKSRAQPLVGVITGSISDQPHMAACYSLLDRFGIPYERGIKSAHRTPDLMATYSKTASARGIKVIIAAAGGAAHLPGMAAAFGADMPVIGVPIKPTIGDGTDSLLSMTNMPRGVPVLTVGVNNSTNAALAAARIIGQWNERVRKEVLKFHNDAAAESQGNDQVMIAEDAERLERVVLI